MKVFVTLGGREFTLEIEGDRAVASSGIPSARRRRVISGV